MNNKAIIFYITRNGLILAKKLQELYPHAKVLKFSAEKAQEVWGGNRNFVFIMAAGIVVRTIAPLIKDKKTDPAVVVLDETGKYAVSLLSGHLGGANELAKKIADFLKGEAVITTASDINNMPSIDLWAREMGLTIDNWTDLPNVASRLLDSGMLMVYIDRQIKENAQIKLADGFFETGDSAFADIVITNKNCIDAKKNDINRQLFMRQKNLVIGVGCNSGASVDEIEEAVKKTLDEADISFQSIESIATIDIKARERGLADFAKRHSFEIKTFSPEELNKVEGINKSEAVFRATGAYAVSEPSAMLAAHSDRLLITKKKIGNVTIAAAIKQRAVVMKTKKSGRINVVGIGPGGIGHVSPYAVEAIERSDVIVGYDSYLGLIQELIKGKRVYSTGMTREIERCKKAVDLAMNGEEVCVVSSGDPGIYAMAGLVFEALKEQKINSVSGNRRAVSDNQQPKTENLLPKDDTAPLLRCCAAAINIEVIPGISALNACAARLGAPLMHDFASISLSDRLTSWDLIEKRLNAAASADLVIVLYNPKSKGRVVHVEKARGIILNYRRPETPVGIVRNAMRENEAVVLTDIENMLQHEINMQTTVIIGNSQTFIWDRWMITPRGYKI